MKHPFPTPYTHDHPPVEDINKLHARSLTVGERAADWVANTVGSWRFIITQSILLSIWVALNITAMVRHWDPYPFILMNLLLSMQAAYTAPIIMMSQNRQSARDRLVSQHDYLINQKAETEIRIIMDHLVAQDRALEEIYEFMQQRMRSDGATAPQRIVNDKAPV